MLVRTGVNEEQLAVVISDPRRDEYGYIMAISIKAILDLYHADNITMDPTVDFTNGYDAGLVDIDAKTRAKLIRWADAGMVVTMYYTASGKPRFGRVPTEKLGLSEEEWFWLNAWGESFDLRSQQLLNEQQAAKAAIAEQAEAKRKQVTQPKPKLKRKERRRQERRAVAGASYA